MTIAVDLGRKAQNKQTKTNIKNEQPHVGNTLAAPQSVMSLFC